jgi:hypothetical protein
MRISTRLSIAAIALFAALAPAPALAGRLVATGHDADSHCSGSDTPSGQCHFVAVAVSYAKAGAPTPGRPLLLLDCSGGHVATAVNSALGPTASTTMCPHTDARFAGEPLIAARYSAIVVGSSTDQLNIDRIVSTPDSNAINARRTAIQDFFNSGGGIVAFSGDANADGDPATPDNYYDFLPTPTGGQLGQSPFVLTAEGRALGFGDGSGGTSDDINCCPTHNSFREPPAGSALAVAERDSSFPALPETLFAEGTIGGGTILEGKPPRVQLPSSRRCLSRRKFRIHIRRPRGTQISSARVYVNGKRARVLKRRALRRRVLVAPVNLRGLPRGTIRVKIIVRTTAGVTVRGVRKYHTCSKKRTPKRRPRL